MKRPELKQFRDLTPDDFARNGVWIACNSADYDESWYDETDEETFRPWTGALPASPQEGMLLVRAELRTADGRTFSGFLTPQHENQPLNLGIIQPQLFLPSGTRTDFWDGMFRRSPGVRNVIYKELGEDPGAIFPIQFAASPGLATGRISGTIPGFIWNSKAGVQIYR